MIRSKSDDGAWEAREDRSLANGTSGPLVYHQRKIDRSTECRSLASMWEPNASCRAGGPPAGSITMAGLLPWLACYRGRTAGSIATTKCG